MGIDPVTHKPVSQVVNEFRNISGHGNSSFKTEPSNNSILTQSNSAWDMMRNNTTTSHESYYNNNNNNNSPMMFEFQTTPFHFSTHSNHLLNGTTSSCSSSSSSASITQPNQGAHQAFRWSDYLLSDPVLPLNSQTQVVGSSATSNLTFAPQAECNSQKIDSKALETCHSASSFVDEILDKDQEMLSQFPQLLNDFDY